MIYELDSQSETIKCRARKVRNYYKKLHDAVLGTLLGTSLSCMMIHVFISGIVNHDFFFIVGNIFWVAGVTIVLTIQFCYSDEEKEVLK